MRSRGFSLIEMIVVLGILSVLIGASLVALIPFGEKRNVLDDSKSLAAEIRQVVNKATAVEVPEGCTSLSSYLLEFGTGDGGRSITVTAECGLGTTSKIIKVLRSSDFNGSPASMRFKVPEGTTSEQRVEVCGSGYLYYLEIGVSGVVSGPEYDDEGC